MKPNYKNWVPKGMVIGYFVSACFLLVATIVFATIGFNDILKWAIALFVVCLVATIFLCVISLFMLMWYNAFSYDGKKQISRRIIEGIAERVVIPAGGNCLDIGCGSGALTNAIAKRNHNAEIIGVDRWGKEYASFSKTLCEDNSKAEGVNNTKFIQGNALKLPFEDCSFDVVTSNYVYHNIPSNNRQEILLETLRVLKKGGSFYIHDLFTKQKYGDMNAFKQKLYELGYEKVELIDTTKGELLTEKESKQLMLSGSALLTGKK